MSFDVFVQGFRDGDAAQISADALHAVFGPLVVAGESDDEFWRVRAPDGGEADIYGVARASDGVMINHVGTGQVVDLLVEFAIRAGAVILAPGCPTMLTDVGQRTELPPELAADVRLVRSGPDLADQLADS